MGDLADYVDSLDHPSYTALGGTRHPGRGDVRRHSQCHHGHARGRPGVNWCAALAAARAASYRLERYYDTVSLRWFLVGADSAWTGQAYFIINPEPKRDLIVEAPHVYAASLDKPDKLEDRTDTEGVLILRQTLGRALLINGADRCQGPDSGCGGTFSSKNVCPNSNAGDRSESDVAHNIDNAFHVLHQKFTDVSASTRLSSCTASGSTPPPERRAVRVGRPYHREPASLATLFVTNIQTLATGALAERCQRLCNRGQHSLWHPQRAGPLHERCHGLLQRRAYVPGRHPLPASRTEERRAVAHRPAAAGDRRAPGDHRVLGELLAPGPGDPKLAPGVQRDHKASGTARWRFVARRSAAWTCGSG